jgi:hypothetical protein
MRARRSTMSAAHGQLIAVPTECAIDHARQEFVAATEGPPQHASGQVESHAVIVFQDQAADWSRVTARTCWVDDLRPLRLECSNPLVDCRQTRIWACRECVYEARHGRRCEQITELVVGELREPIARGSDDRFR